MLALLTIFMNCKHLYRLLRSLVPSYMKLGTKERKSVKQMLSFIEQMS